MRKNTNRIYVTDWTDFFAFINVIETKKCVVQSNINVICFRCTKTNLQIDKISDLSVKNAQQSRNRIVCVFLLPYLLFLAV